MKYIFVLIALACVPAALNADVLHKTEFQADNGAPNMQTNIALIGSKAKLGDQSGLAIVDPTGALEEATSNNSDGDIQEDPRDPFITSKTGKLRPKLIDNGDEWADEELVVDSRKQSGNEKVLSRKKRCGDDDGDARRSRRARRARARRARRARARAARNAAKSSTTTVVRKVIQNGQVVSQTTETQGAAAVATQPGQVIVQHQPAAPVVQSVQPLQTVQPVAVAQPAAASVAAPGMPSIAVTGSVKVN